MNNFSKKIMAILVVFTVMASVNMASAETDLSGFDFSAGSGDQPVVTPIQLEVPNDNQGGVGNPQLFGDLNGEAGGSGGVASTGTIIIHADLSGGTAATNSSTSIHINLGEQFASSTSSMTNGEFSPTVNPVLPAPEVLAPEVPVKPVAPEEIVPAPNTIRPIQEIDSYSQAVVLYPGWNIISVPRTVQSHVFSVPETSENFDIYVLDGNQQNNWATMADLNQTEFVPLYGYFINNKTNSRQVLKFIYQSELSLGQKLLERRFEKAGWYSFGVANKTYTAQQCHRYVDNDNPSQLLNTLTGKFGAVVDFGQKEQGNEWGGNLDSVWLNYEWNFKTATDVNQLPDLRDTKGYAVYITDPGASIIGMQDAYDVANFCNLRFVFGNDASVSKYVLAPGEKGVDIGAFSLLVSNPYGYSMQKDFSLNVKKIVIRTGSYFPFKNLRLWKSEYGVMSVANPEPNQQYTLEIPSHYGNFDIHQEGRWWNDVIHVYADINEDALPVSDRAFIYLQDVTAVDRTSGLQRSFEDNYYWGRDLPKQGQKISIADSELVGKLAVTIDENTPASNMVPAGSDQILTRLKFTASSVEKIFLQSLDISAEGERRYRNISNFKIIDNDGKDLTNYSYDILNFYNLFAIPAGESVSVDVVGRINDGAVSGDKLKVGIKLKKWDYDGEYLRPESVIASGALSSVPITGSHLEIGGAVHADIWGNEMTIGGGTAVPGGDRNACPADVTGKIVKKVGEPSLYFAKKPMYEGDTVKLISVFDQDTLDSWQQDVVPVEVNQDCFDYLAVDKSYYPSYMIYRSGTFVVRPEYSDQLYVVVPDNATIPISLENAKLLYSDDFKVKVIPMNLWSENYNLNYPGGSTGAFPHSGMLVAKDNKIYYVYYDKTLAEVTPEGFVANGFQERFVRNLPESALVGFTVDDSLKIDKQVFEMFNEFYGSKG